MDPSPIALVGDYQITGKYGHALTEGRWLSALRDREHG
jgi:hypothetical protein